MLDKFSAKYSSVTSRIPVLGWYLLWLCIILYLYWPSIIILPKRDHAILMMGRHLVENDWQWFLDVLSYNRTRLLQPGDYFAFRPVHMAVLALVDIFARTDFVMQGVFSCLIMAGTATIFCSLCRRLTGILNASALTLLWTAQLAGVEIILWQHINPYLLAPACMFGALLLITRDSWSRKQALYAAAAILTACLTHELCVLISTAMFILFLLFDRHSCYRVRVLTTFLPAVTIALLLNGVDYKIIHPPPSILGPSDAITTSFSAQSLYHELTPLAGAIGSAFFRPDSVNITLTDEFSFLWIFTDISHTNLLANGIIIYLLLTVLCGLVIRQIFTHGVTANSLIGLYFLLFFGAIFGITSFRVLTRGIGYMFGAGYYFSLFSLALCGVLAYLLSHTGKRTRYCATVLTFGLAIWHAGVLHQTLATTTDAKKGYASQIYAIRTQLEHDQAICFGGMDPFSVPVNLRGWMPLFYDLSCSTRPTATPQYIGYNASGLGLMERKFILQPADTDLLPTLLYNQPYLQNTATEIASPVIPFGYPVDITIRSASPFNIIVAPEYEMPYSFKVHYNELLADEHAYDNTLAWNSSTTENAIRIQFSSSDILFFVNNMLITAVPRTRTATGKNCSIKISPKHPGMYMKLTRFSVASKPTELIAIR